MQLWRWREIHLGMRVVYGWLLLVAFMCSCAESSLTAGPLARSPFALDAASFTACHPLEMDEEIATRVLGGALPDDAADYVISSVDVETTSGLQVERVSLIIDKGAEHTLATGFLTLVEPSIPIGRTLQTAQSVLDLPADLSGQQYGGHAAAILVSARRVGSAPDDGRDRIIIRGVEYTYKGRAFRLEVRHAITVLETPAAFDDWEGVCGPGYFDGLDNRRMLVDSG